MQDEQKGAEDSHTSIKWLRPQISVPLCTANLTCIKQSPLSPVTVTFSKVPKRFSSFLNFIHIHLTVTLTSCIILVRWIHCTCVWSLVAFYLLSFDTRKVETLANITHINSTKRSIQTRATSLPFVTSRTSAAFFFFAVKQPNLQIDK